MKELERQSLSGVWLAHDRLWGSTAVVLLKLPWQTTLTLGSFGRAKVSCSPAGAQLCATECSAEPSPLPCF